jgi:hypothetical protein
MDKKIKGIEESVRIPICSAYVHGNYGCVLEYESGIDTVSCVVYD